MTPNRLLARDRHERRHVLESRVDAYCTNVSTSHWPHEFHRAGCPPEGMIKDRVIGTEMSRIQQSLIGVDALAELDKEDAEAAAAAAASWWPRCTIM